MSEINAKYTHKVQAKTRPKPEEIIGEILTGERKENALNFVAWLRENKLSPAWNTSNGWRSNYKGKPICYITVGKHPENNIADTWNVNAITHEKQSEGNENHPLFDEKVKEMAWNMVRQCKSCSNNVWHKDGISKTLYGKVIRGCHGTHYGGVIDSDTQTLEVMKKIILISKDAIADK